MDFCDICLDPPRPLEGRITGAVRLDAVEGNRRLLAELSGCRKLSCQRLRREG